jgi:soluble lytic murein transglycosylase
VDIIDWVERIPYRETRNYVMRVLENINNYRSLHPHPKLTLVDDLKRGVVKASHTQNHKLGPKR